MPKQIMLKSHNILLNIPHQLREQKNQVQSKRTKMVSMIRKTHTMEEKHSIKKHLIADPFLGVGLAHLP
ncbi:hypothetical protein JHK85_017408 [Glycine max]|nr:hypothetical protein JHK85_017408 [Glycine max]KAG5047629.1 hypothetical protein JHK86_017035 [Glycine max]